MILPWCGNAQRPQLRRIFFVNYLQIGVVLFGINPNAHVAGVEAVQVADVRAHHRQLPGQQEAHVEVEVLGHGQLAVVAAHLLHKSPAVAHVALDEMLGPENGL